MFDGLGEMVELLFWLVAVLLFCLVWSLFGTFTGWWLCAFVVYSVVVRRMLR